VKRPDRFARRVLLAGALALTLAAVRWAGGEDPGPVAAATNVDITGTQVAVLRAASAVGSTAAVASAAADSEAIDLSRLKRPPQAAAVTDLFAVPQAPAPVHAPEARTKPTAPPLPYTFFGRMVEGNATRVFLARGELTFAVSPGDTLDGVYRVEQVTDTAVALTYLPLDIKQNLDIGTIQ
jgi:hypothetical protein